MKQTALLLLLTIITLPAVSAGIYRCKDENGRVRFSDSLCPSAELIEIQVNSGVQFPSREWPNSSPKQYRSGLQKKGLGYSDKKKLRYYERERAKVLQKLQNPRSSFNQRQKLQKELIKLGGKITAIQKPITRTGKPAEHRPSIKQAKPAHKGAFDVTTGQHYPSAAGGVINPRTGEFYPEVAGGYIRPSTDDFLPSH